MAGVLRRYWWLVVGLSIVIIGIGLVTASRAWEGSSGAFSWAGDPSQADAYWAALEAEFARRTYLLWGGVLTAVAGLLVIAVGVGYRLGQRQQPA
jgi:uncharacterized membrane protein